MDCIITLNNILYYENGERKRVEQKHLAEPFKYLSKYLYAIQGISENPFKEEKVSNIIWQCWLQGEDNMPDLVKVCTDSVKKYSQGKEVVLITENDFMQYVSVPDYILEKKKQGIIPNAQFADILRLMLLEKYGGVWIDSTILLTGNIPPEVFEEDFFTYKNTSGQNFEYVKTFKDLEIMCNHLNTSIMLPSTWLISAGKNNIIISEWLKLLLEYWKTENRLIDYFIMDYFFVLLLLNNKACRDIFEKVPVFLTTPCEILQSAISEMYDEEVFERIKSMSSVHKLTLNYVPDNSIQDRFYHRIIRNQV